MVMTQTDARTRSVGADHICWTDAEIRPLRFTCWLLCKGLCVIYSARSDLRRPFLTVRFCLCKHVVGWKSQQIFTPCILYVVLLSVDSIIRAASAVEGRSLMRNHAKAPISPFVFARKASLVSTYKRNLCVIRALIRQGHLLLIQIKCFLCKAFSSKQA